MPDIEGVLSCLLAVGGPTLRVDVVAVLQAGVLVAAEGPLSLELLLGTAQLPEERQIMGKVVD